MLLSLVNTEPRYNALANDLRLAGYGTAPSSSSGASASGVAGGASSGSGGGGLSGSSLSHSASSSRQHNPSSQLSAVPPSHIPAATLPLSYPMSQSSASQPHDVGESSAAPVHDSGGMLAGCKSPRKTSGDQAKTDHSDNAAESFYRPFTLQELRKVRNVVYVRVCTLLTCVHSR